MYDKIMSTGRRRSRVEVEEEKVNGMILMMVQWMMSNVLDY